MPQQYDIQGDIEASRTSRRWAALFIFVAANLSLALIWLFVQNYYGEDGVRFAGIAVGIALLILFIVGLGVGVVFVASGMMMRHHDNVLSGLVDFQREDDRGEVARTVASGMAGAMKVNGQIDRDVIRLAGRFGQQQAQALITAKQQDDRQQASAPTWAMSTYDSEVGDFRYVE